MNFLIFTLNNDGRRSYIMNIEPYIYTDDISKAKIFKYKYTPQYYIYRNYDMHVHLQSLLDSKAINSVWLLTTDENGKEIECTRMI